MSRYRLLLGDTFLLLPKFKENSIDAVVTDPPYGLEFMGKEWDKLGGFRDPEQAKGNLSGWEPRHNANMQEWHQQWATEILRVLKPGGYLLAFGGSRTYHRLACAVEDAGFEIRDQLQWIYGSGFPKSHNISKAMDKTLGVQRPVVGTRKVPGFAKSNVEHGTQDRTKYEFEETSNKPISEIAQQYDGYGTALKPAHEPIVMARKPLSEKTVAANVQQWGVGALNINACRIGTTGPAINRWTDGSKPFGGGAGHPYESTGPTTGRWPANIILDEEAGTMLDEQSGNRPAGSGNGNAIVGETSKGSIPPIRRGTLTPRNDVGGASRFFYCAKANKKERGVFNKHPTVKPLELMKYLCRLITPPNGLILDPFMGSGTTGLAALAEGFQFIGIERQKEYFEWAQKRIEEINATD